MALSLKHNFQSQKADGSDSSLIQPSNWNAEHTITMAGQRLVGRGTTGTGAAAEISVSADLSLSGTTLALSTTFRDKVNNHIGAGGTAHPAVTSSSNGFMSSADKTKLDAVATEATKNETDAYLLDRTKHTGKDPISAVDGLQAALDAKAGFYAGANSNEQNLPIGHAVLVRDGDPTGRNQQYGVYLKSSQAFAYTFNGGNSAGQLAGTWRTRGKDTATMMQRTL